MSVPPYFLHWGQITTAVTVSGGIAASGVVKDIQARGKTTTTGSTGAIKGQTARGRSRGIQGSGSSSGVSGKGRNG